MGGFGNGDDYDSRDDNDQHDDHSQDNSTDHGGSDPPSIFDDMSNAIADAGPYLGADGEPDSAADDSNGGESDDKGYESQSTPSDDGGEGSEDRDDSGYSNDADDIERLDGDHDDGSDSTDQRDEDEGNFSPEEEEAMIRDYLDTGQSQGNPDAFVDEPPDEELPDME